MNSVECASVQRLVADLEDTRLIYATLRPLLIRPHLKFLVERIGASHAAIADDLAAQMAPAGVARAASRLARVRARIERWIAISNLDIELGCLGRIARHETRVIQRFRRTLDDVKGLPQNLHRELSQLERSLFRVESLMREMEMPRLAAAIPRRRTDVIPLSSHARHRP